MRVTRSEPSGESFANVEAKKEPKKTAPNKVVTGASTGSKKPAVAEEEAGR